MNKRLLWIIAALAGVVVLAAAGWLAALAVERDYQAGATAKRVSDTHKIAEAIERYRTQTSHLPYEDAEPPPGYGRLPVVVRIVSPASDGQFAAGPPPFQLDTFVDVPGPRFAARLSQASRAAVPVPVDPQRVPNGRPNAYYVIFSPEAGYAVLSFIDRPVKGSTYAAKRAHIYSVGREWPANFLPALHLKPITTGSLPPAERSAIAAAGHSADRRFERYVPVAIEASFGR